jgi:hypothetical protein
MGMNFNRAQDYVAVIRAFSDGWKGSLGGFPPGESLYRTESVSLTAACFFIFEIRTAQLGMRMGRRCKLQHV